MGHLFKVLICCWKNFKINDFLTFVLGRKFGKNGGFLAAKGISPLANDIWLIIPFLKVRHLSRGCAIDTLSPLRSFDDRALHRYSKLIQSHGQQL
jgi:hypothetical protein